MQLRFKNAFIWAFSALFGCISLGGQGWHYAFDHGVHGTPHDDHAEPCGPAPDLPIQLEGLIAAENTSEHDHDCPICSFFSQAQCGALIVSLEATGHSHLHTTPLDLAYTASFAAVYRSRAPPAIATLA